MIMPHVLTATTNSPDSGRFYSTIPNRETIIAPCTKRDLLTSVLTFVACPQSTTMDIPTFIGLSLSRPRKQGWLTEAWHRTFREILTHSLGRFDLACPVYCPMPDHVHMLWVGHSPRSDQQRAMTHFRKATNKLLLKPAYVWQEQAYDHVLSSDEREKGAFEATAEYIRQNPVRAGLFKEDEPEAFSFQGCLVPGYPDLNPQQENYWELFWRIYWKLHSQ